MVEKSLTILSRLQAVKQIDFINKAEEVLGSEAEAIHAVVRRRLLAWVKDFKLKPCFPLLAALADLGFQGDDNLILDSICADIANGTFKDIEKSIQEKTFAAVTGTENENVLLAIVKTQKALNHGGRTEIQDAFKDVFPGGFGSPGKGTGSPAIRARMFANATSYYLGICDTHAAADSVKEAMLLTQNENAGRGLARIYRFFSLVEFSNHRLSDALDYFSFAMEHAEKSKDLPELGISAYYAAVAHFIYGNISKARHLAVQSQEAALDAVLPDWADRSRFLEGRLCFETGLYQEALDIFRDLRNNPLGPETEAFTQTVNAWIHRSAIYLNNGGAAKKLAETKGLDARLFETEAAFIIGDYRKALELTSTLEQMELGERFVLIEQPDWRSGFYQCELLLFPLRDLWNRMIHTFRVLAVCFTNKKEQPADSRDQDEAIRKMQRIIRDELPETDPNDAFYLYSYYRILKRTGAPEVDLNTAISIAFKRLQTRASRIDNNETKRAFLSTHHWNSALAEAAREHKLI